MATDSWRVPFPDLPGKIVGRYPYKKLFLRPFCQDRKDLDIDFTATPRVHLITEILACCSMDEEGRQPESAFFWDLTVGKRIELLMIIAISKESSGFAQKLRCQSENCHELMEIELTQEEVTHLQQSADETFSFPLPLPDHELTMRKPTGNDQLKWLLHRYPDERAATCRMIRSLLDEKSEQLEDDLLMKPEALAIINETMQHHDPLVNFSLAVECPVCNEAADHPIDLEGELLTRLERQQQLLLGQVHTLASCYHWTEQEFFAIPPWRRNCYLARIDSKGGL